MTNDKSWIIFEYLGLHNFKMVLAFSSHSKLVYDVAINHMALRFEIVLLETANW